MSDDFSFFESLAGQSDVADESAIGHEVVSPVPTVQETFAHAEPPPVHPQSIPITAVADVIPGDKLDPWQQVVPASVDVVKPLASTSYQDPFAVDSGSHDADASFFENLGLEDAHPPQQQIRHDDMGMMSYASVATPNQTLPRSASNSSMASVPLSSPSPQVLHHAPMTIHPAQVPYVQSDQARGQPPTPTFASPSVAAAPLPAPLFIAAPYVPPAASGFPQSSIPASGFPQSSIPVAPFMPPNPNNPPLAPVVMPLAPSSTPMPATSPSASNQFAAPAHVPIAQMQHVPVSQPSVEDEKASIAAQLIEQQRLLQQQLQDLQMKMASLQGQSVPAVMSMPSMPVAQPSANSYYPGSSAHSTVSTIPFEARDRVMFREAGTMVPCVSFSLHSIVATFPRKPKPLSAMATIPQIIKPGNVHVVPLSRLSLLGHGFVEDEEAYSSLFPIDLARFPNKEYLSFIAAHRDSIIRRVLTSEFSGLLEGKHADRLSLLRAVFAEELGPHAYAQHYTEEELLLADREGRGREHVLQSLLESRKFPLALIYASTMDKRAFQQAIIAFTDTVSSDYSRAFLYMVANRPDLSLNKMGNVVDLNMNPGAAAQSHMAAMPASLLDGSHSHVSSSKPFSPIADLAFQLANPTPALEKYCTAQGDRYASQVHLNSLNAIYALVHYLVGHTAIEPSSSRVRSFQVVSEVDVAPLARGAPVSPAVMRMTEFYVAVVHCSTQSAEKKSHLDKVMRELRLYYAEQLASMGLYHRADKYLAQADDTKRAASLRAFLESAKHGLGKEGGVHKRVSSFFNFFSGSSSTSTAPVATVSTSVPTPVSASVASSSNSVSNSMAAYPTAPTAPAPPVAATPAQTVPSQPSGGAQKTEAPGFLRKLFGGRAKEVQLGESLEAHYDERLGRWVFPGEDPNAMQSSAPPPPPTMMVASTTPTHNSFTPSSAFAPAPVSNTGYTTGPASSTIGQLPVVPQVMPGAPMAPMAPMMGPSVGARYVDPFGLSGGAPPAMAASTVVPPVPSAMVRPQSMGNLQAPRFFVPKAPVVTAQEDASALSQPPVGPPS